MAMTSVDQGSHARALVYIDRSEIREGKVDELRAGVRRLVDFVDEHEPQLIAYAFHIDEDSGQMTVVAVHPDSESLEFHIEVAGGEFRKLAHLITLREVRIYGRPSERALALLHQKAEMLGEGVTVLVHEPHAGFVRPTVQEAVRYPLELAPTLSRDLAAGRLRAVRPRRSERG
jgi:hypothetical protein